MDALGGALHDPTHGLLDETHVFDRLLAGASAQRLLQRFLDAGGQTAEGERGIAALVADLDDPGGEAG